MAIQKSSLDFIAPNGHNGCSARPIILRGTDAWNDRERMRKSDGCTCMSFGSLADSILTRGKSALIDPQDV